MEILFLKDWLKSQEQQFQFITSDEDSVFRLKDDVMFSVGQVVKIYNPDRNSYFIRKISSFSKDMIHVNFVKPSIVILPVAINEILEMAQPYKYKEIIKLN